MLQICRVHICPFSWTCIASKKVKIGGVRDKIEIDGYIEKKMQRKQPEGNGALDRETDRLG